ncbi:hypothetical protein J2755_000963 [Methanohalophilus levihalophilus]|uniref:DUF4145 domain-containing protein n=1 Tax=Methanohalophilus levihalophilus TaxID=1431282 RepID=UPI001AE110C1|nr:DUF4145 domain-containing protein [Methanohalophilus levihalophilus]MBP2030029.1 hypothetical protein [Methanohalophilus levihalophilus]
MYEDDHYEDDSGAAAGALILGGILGAVFASTKPEDKQKIANYDRLLLETKHLKEEHSKAIEDAEKYREMMNYLEQNRAKLGDTSGLGFLDVHPAAKSLFNEAFNMFLYGFNRAACVFAIATIENILSLKYGDKMTFYDMVEKAKKDGFISESNKHYLHGLRSDRNSLIHDCRHEISEDESLILMKLTIRVIGSLS